MSEPEQNDFDDDFMRALAVWRERHQLREDDAVMLLVDLFRIHQSHWDELRRREMPSFDQFRSDIAKVTDAARTFQQETSVLVEVLQNKPTARSTVRITRSAAFFAALATLLAGYLIGRVWP